MGEVIKNTSNELKERWMQRMPPFFRGLVRICACIVATALAVNQIMITGGATPHEWWTDIYPLLLSVPTGMAVVCKLTVAGGYKHINTDSLTQGSYNGIINNDPPEEAGETDNTNTFI